MTLSIAAISMATKTQAEEITNAAIVTVRGVQNGQVDHVAVAATGRATRPPGVIAKAKNHANIVTDDRVLDLTAVTGILGDQEIPWDHRRRPVDEKAWAPETRATTEKIAVAVVVEAVVGGTDHPGKTGGKIVDGKGRARRD